MPAPLLTEPVRLPAPNWRGERVKGRCRQISSRGECLLGVETVVGADQVVLGVGEDEGVEVG